MITSLGFIVSSIPFLNQIPLGGRLSRCIDNWEKVTDSKWIRNVVSQGYKIPFKYPPKQKRVPTNPVASGPAHDVLVAEAADLLLKEAVVMVDPVPGQYVSSYFAVTKPRSPGKFRPILNLEIQSFCKKVQILNGGPKTSTRLDQTRCMVLWHGFERCIFAYTCL